MRQIDAVCRRFEADYRAGKSPAIADYLGEIPEAGRSALRTELIGLEQELRRSDETSARPDSGPIADAPTVAPASLPTAPIPSLGNPSVHEEATVAPRDQDTVDLGSCEPAPLDASGPARVRYFGDYEIARELARGGMGVVFQARQISLNRKVALKMILAGQLANETDVKRFYTEAEAAANLDHPGIVPIFEVGQHEGQHYFSMGFVEGQSLAQKLADGPLPPREAAALMAKVCEAIAYAHERGVIHRDLKPANILLDRSCNPRVTDFGLAKKLEADSGLTGSGQIMGSPSYMPPEQAGGQRGEVGPAADVYALGATLYALLTGRPPFQAATAMDTVIQVIREDPVPPRRLNASVTRDLETICLRCLEKEPARRYGSARQLAEELGRFLDGRPILARPISERERLVKWARRRPAIAAMAAAMLIVGLAGMSGIIWQWHAAIAAERETARLAVRLMFDRATGPTARDDPGEGLLWLARALERPADEPMERLLRLSLDAWSRQVPALERVLPAEEGASDIAFSPDSRRVVRSRGQSAILWDLDEGRPVGPRFEHRGFVTLAAFTPDGRMLATAALDGTARVWDVQTGEPGGAPLDHLGVPFAMAVALDARHLAVASTDLVHLGQTKPMKTACHLWDLAARRRIDVGSEAASYLAFDPEGRVLAVGLITRLLRWDVAGQRFLPPIELGVQGGPITALASLPGGDLLIASADKRIARVPVTSSDERTQFDGRTPFRVTAMTADATRPDPWILAGFEDQAARLMRGRRGASGGSAEEVGHEELWHPRRIMQTAFGSDGRTLLTSDGTARRWRRPPGQALGPEVPDIGGDGTPRTWASPDGRRLVVGDGKGVYRLVDGMTGRPVGGPSPISAGDPDEVSLTVAFRPDGRRMVTCRTRTRPRPGAGGGPPTRLVTDQELRPWDAMTGQPIGPPIPIKVFGLEVSFTPDGRRVRADEIGGIRLLDADTLHPDPAWDRVRGRARQPVVQVSPSPDGRWWLTWSGPGGSPLAEAAACQLWEPDTGQLLGELDSPDGPIREVVFGADVRRLATGHEVRGKSASESRRVTRLWELPACRPIGGDIDGALPWALSADGSALLTRSNQDVQLREVPSGRPVGPPLKLQRSEQFPPRESAARFSPDGRLLAIGTEDRYAQLIDVRTGRPSRPRLPHAGPVVALAFSPDGELLLTGSSDGTARFWHVGTGRPVGPPLEELGRRVDRVAFSLDGRSAVICYKASDSCTTVRHWAAPVAWEGSSSAIRDRVERMTNRRLDAEDVARPLTAAEWHATGDRARRALPESAWP
jgi:WD40 repeat protein